MTAAQQRFWKYVDKNGPVPATYPELGPCWLWLGGILWNGYGVFTVFKNATAQQRQAAHKFLYEQIYGSVPDGFQLDHLCRVRHCVNPNHMEAVTRKENILRGESFSAINARKTYCKRGHALTGRNLFIKRSGYRNCRTCLNALRREKRSQPAETEQKK